jgi:hypothetical protein
MKNVFRFQSFNLFSKSYHNRTRLYVYLIYIESKKISSKIFYLSYFEMTYSLTRLNLKHYKY